MAGLRKSQQIKTLERLYEQKAIKFDVKEIQELSTHQLRNKINQIRGYRYKGVLA